LRGDNGPGAARGIPHARNVGFAPNNDSTISRCGLASSPERHCGVQRMTEEDARRSANAMIRLHGDRAAIEASMMAERLRVRADAPGHDAWRRIALILHELRDKQDRA
jgi:hypothetical protein